MGSRKRPSRNDFAEAHVRWALRRDLKEMEEIDSRYLYQACSPGWIATALRGKRVIGKVLECEHPGYEGRVLGFMVYSIEKERYVVLKLAVLPELRRRGIGRSMMSVLMGGLGSKRNEIVTIAHEEDVVARCFFKSLGFKAIGIATRPWPADQGDGNRYRFRLIESAARPLRRAVIRVSR